jgi:hypothetical protein
MKKVVELEAQHKAQIDIISEALSGDELGKKLISSLNLAWESFRKGLLEINDLKHPSLQESYLKYLVKEYQAFAQISLCLLHLSMV